MDLKHGGTRSIKIERLFLRRFNINDVEDAFAKWSGSSKISRFVMRGPHKDVVETRKML